MAPVYSKAMSTPYTKLPLELVIRVFETGCEDDNSFCRDIALVSSWARKASLPYLYRSPILKDFTIVLHLNRTTQGFSVSENRLVKGLWLPDVWDCHAGALISMWNLCPELKHFALNMSSLTRMMTSVASTDAGLHRGDIHLTITGQPLEWTNLLGYWRLSPMYNVVTHIHFTNIIPLSFSHFFEAFTALTHLAMPFSFELAEDFWRVATPGTIRLPEKVESFVITLYDSEHLGSVQFITWWERERGQDERWKLVHVNPKDAQKNWKASIDGDDIWRRAERAAARRKQDKAGVGY